MKAPKDIKELKAYIKTINSVEASISDEINFLFKEIKEESWKENQIPLIRNTLLILASSFIAYDVLFLIIPKISWASEIIKQDKKLWTIAIAAIPVLIGGSNFVAVTREKTNIITSKSRNKVEKIIELIESQK